MCTCEGVLPTTYIDSYCLILSNVWRNTRLWVVYPTCTHGRCWQHVPCWHHHLNPQDSGHAPSRLQVHIGVCKSLIRKEKIFGRLAPDPLWPSSPSASTSRLYRQFLCSRTSGSRNQISHTTPWTWWLWSRSVLLYCDINRGFHKFGRGALNHLLQSD